MTRPVPPALAAVSGIDAALSLSAGDAVFRGVDEALSLLSSNSFTRGEVHLILSVLLLPLRSRKIAKCSNTKV